MNNKQLIVRKNETVKNIVTWIFFFVITFLFLLKSPFHIWNHGVSKTDSSVFQTIALMMKQGAMPYLDTFDHKGPFIYILNWLGMTLFNSNGMFIIEFVCLFITINYLYKTARLICNRTNSIIVMLLSISMLFSCFEGGNLPEEYAMPFIAISLYIFLDYLLYQKVSKIRIIICRLLFWKRLIT